MKELDFSGISTEQLKHAILHKTNGAPCTGISCDDCAMSQWRCNNDKVEEIHELFKEELNRREKDMNEMPELKAGMIIRGNIGDNLFLYINESWAMNLNDRVYWTNPSRHDNDWIIEVFECVHYSKTYTTCTENLKLMWSRKSDKDIEIEEIQKEMDKLNKRMEGLKSDKNS